MRTTHWNHTPGPWHTQGCTIYAGKNRVAQTWDAEYDGMPTHQMEADAGLISAAPELLAALEGILMIRPDYHAGRDDLWLNRGEVERIAREAIAKAKGGAK